MWQFEKSYSKVHLLKNCRCEYEYNLILSTDFNTNGHTQWYFFSVANTRKNV